MSGLLSTEAFFSALKGLKLVSVDLLLRNEEGEYLLGYRTNQPARGTWFVPGGVVRKPETVQEALERVCQVELGISAVGVRFACLAQHFYEENFREVEGVPTHYVALAYELTLPKEMELKLDTQHESVRWWSVAELLASSAVHSYTKAYFQADAAQGAEETILFRA